MEKTTTSRRLLLAVLLRGVASATGGATPPPSASFAETTSDPRSGACEAHYYGPRSGLTYGRYKPRYGHCWWW
jgi:hypothetical protein